MIKIEQLCPGIKVKVKVHNIHRADPNIPLVVTEVDIIDKIIYCTIPGIGQRDFYIDEISEILSFDKETLSKQLGDLINQELKIKLEINSVEKKLEYLKEANKEEYVPEEYRNYALLKILRDDTLSPEDKAQVIEQLTKE